MTTEFWVLLITIGLMWYALERRIKDIQRGLQSRANRENEQAFVEIDFRNVDDMMTWSLSNAPRFYGYASNVLDDPYGDGEFKKYCEEFPRLGEARPDRDLASMLVGYVHGKVFSPLAPFDDADDVLICRIERQLKHQEEYPGDEETE